MSPARFAIKHPVVVAMLLIVLVAFGVFSVYNQNIAFMSDVNLPSIIVYTVYPGASASDVERDVTKILEDQFVTLPNYKSMNSVSQDSVSFIQVYYQDTVDPYDQLQEIRYRISTMKDRLPSGLQGDPQALVGASSMIPAIIFTVDGGSDMARTTKYVSDTLRPKINQISGVSDITVYGGKELETQVRLRSEDLVSKGISVLQVYQMIQASNSELPLGGAEYKDRTINMRYEGSFSGVEDLRNLTVGVDDDGNLIRLRDVADVSLGYPKPTSEVNSDGKDLLLVSVSNRTDGNIVRICDAVKHILAQEGKSTGGAVKFTVLNDYSETTKASLSTVVESGVLGVVMAVLVILLFLMDGRMTLIIGLSIPLSVLFTFIGMRLMGISLNLMSLSGLVIALGMVVDASVVMLEEVYRHYRTRTMDLDECIIKGSGEVTSSILASTVTTIVVFIPIALLQGLVGMILKEVAETLILAMAGSFLVAVLFVPFLLKLLLRKKCPEMKDHAIDRGMRRLETHYKGWLIWSMDNRGFVFLLSISMLVLTVFISKKLGVSFIPSTDNGDFYVDMEFPRGYSLARTEEKTAVAEKIVRDIVPEMKNLAAFQGKSEGMSFIGDNSNEAYFYINLVPVKRRDRNVHQIMLAVQKALDDQIPDCKVKVKNGGFDKLLSYASGGGGYGITLVSEDMDLLYKEANRIQQQLRKDPSVVETEMDTSFDTYSLIIRMAQDYMAGLGVSSIEAGLTARILFSGVECGRYNSADGNRYAIQLDSDLMDQPITFDRLSQVQVKSLGGTLVDFSNLGDFVMQNSVSAINHTDRAKTITVSATLVSEDALPVTTRMNQYLAEHPLDNGVTSKRGGIGELIADSIPSMVRALVIAWFLVYTVMVLQFERFRQPFIIMLTIPFCVIGVIVGLLLFGSTLSLLSLLGLISLGGVVVNNGIILIDYVNQYRSWNPCAGGEDERVHLKKMIAEGASTRLRPIFMTTLTTMLGVVPMAVARGEGSELYAPLGQAIAGGLFTSTLITLFLIPTMYYITEERVLRKKERGRHEKT
ncbi:MAG: efflux RND transporter permease subunit [Sphaerochaetaceae bacterium]